MSYNPNSIWTGKKKDPAYTPEALKKPSPETEKQPIFKGPKGPREPFFKKTAVEKFDEPEPSKRRVLFWSVIAGAVVLVGIIIYVFVLRATPGPNVSIEFSKPDQVLTGDQFHFG